MNDFPGYTMVTTDKIEVTPFGSKAYTVKENGRLIGTISKENDYTFVGSLGFGMGAVKIGIAKNAHAAAVAIVNAQY